MKNKAKSILDTFNEMPTRPRNVIIKEFAESNPFIDEIASSFTKKRLKKMGWNVKNWGLSQQRELTIKLLLWAVCTDRFDILILAAKGAKRGD